MIIKRRALLIAALLSSLAAGTLRAATVTVGTVNGDPGTSVDLPINFTASGTGISTIQFDLPLPAGLSSGTVTAGAATTSAGKSVASSFVNGSIRVLIFGLNQTTFASGSLATVRLTIAANASAGVRTMTVNAIVGSDSAGVQTAVTGVNGSVTVNGASADTTAPSIPSNLAATPISTSQINLSWTASTDNVGVTGYHVSRGGVIIATVTTTSFQSTGLTPSVTYTYTVRAIDAAGNVSANSSSVLATTLSAPDVTAPSIPAGLTATPASSTQVNLSWTASTDNVGVTGYHVLRGGVVIATVTATSYQNTGLTPSTAYSYMVRAFDAAGNISGNSNAASGTTSAAANQPPVVSVISHNAVDVDSSRSGLQIYDGTSVTYTGSATDPDGNPLTWQWIYTVNGGSEFPMSSGASPTSVQPQVFNYPSGSAPLTYIWILRASDGQATAQRTLQVEVVVRPSVPPPPPPPPTTPPPPPPPPTSTTLPTPVLHLDAYMPVNGQISVDYPDNTSAVSFQWTMTLESPASGTSSVFGALGRAASANFPTIGKVANLSTLYLQPGRYNVTVRAANGTGLFSAAAQGNVTLVAADFASVQIYPNPWRSDRHTGQDLQFVNLPLGTTVKIFTLAGHHVRTLNPAGSTAAWDLKTDSGDKVASGLYIYLLTSSSGSKIRGKFSIIK